MEGKIVIEGKVVFYPQECKLTPLGVPGTETILHAPVSRLLLLLLQQPGETVKQDIVFREVWEKYGQAVTMNALYQNISLLRKCLRNAGLLNSTIKTIPKIGFAFKGKVEFIEDLRGGIPEERMGSSVISRSENRYSLIAFFALLKAAWLQVFKLKWLTHVVYLTVLIILIYFLQRDSSEHREQFVYAHNWISRIDKCNVYVDKDNFKANWSKYISVLESKGVNCLEGEFIYIAKTKDSKDFVYVLVCSSTEPERGLQCKTRYTVTENNINTVVE